MILYGVLSPPYFDPSYDKFCLKVKVGYEEGQVTDDEMMFDFEDDAKAIYDQSLRQFTFMSEADIMKAIERSRNADTKTKGM